MFLKNKNIIFKIRRPKVTDYAALIETKVTCSGGFVLLLLSIITFVYNNNTDGLNHFFNLHIHLFYANVKRTLQLIF